MVNDHPMTLCHRPHLRHHRTTRSAIRRFLFATPRNWRWSPKTHDVGHNASLVFVSLSLQRFCDELKTPPHIVGQFSPSLTSTTNVLLEPDPNDLITNVTPREPRRIPLPCLRGHARGTMPQPLCSKQWEGDGREEQGLVEETPGDGLLVCKSHRDEQLRHGHDVRCILITARIITRCIHPTPPLLKYLHDGHLTFIPLFRFVTPSVGSKV